MTESQGSEHRSKKKWYIVAGTLVIGLLAFLANIDGTLGLAERLTGSDEPDTGDRGATASAGPASVGPVVTTPASGPADPSPDSSAPSLTEGWFDLTAYDSVAHGNGHDSVDAITIGTKDYPNSIRGSYSSSASDPNNRRTWLVGGTCTRFTAWVGKDAASPKSAGTGRFVVKAEDIEIGAADATMTDQPRKIDLDITGVSRLTLLDTRGRLDADNAWGSPRVLCSGPPGQAK